MEKKRHAIRRVNPEDCFYDDREWKGHCFMTIHRRF